MLQHQPPPPCWAAPLGAERRAGRLARVTLGAVMCTGHPRVFHGVGVQQVPAHGLPSDTSKTISSDKRNKVNYIINPNKQREPHELDYTRQTISSDKRNKVVNFIDPPNKQPNLKQQDGKQPNLKQPNDKQPNPPSKGDNQNSTAVNSLPPDHPSNSIEPVSNSCQLTPKQLQEIKAALEVIYGPNVPEGSSQKEKAPQQASRTTALLPNGNSKTAPLAETPQVQGTTQKKTPPTGSKLKRTNSIHNGDHPLLASKTASGTKGLVFHRRRSLATLPVDQLLRLNGSGDSSGCPGTPSQTLSWTSSKILSTQTDVLLSSQLLRANDDDKGSSIRRRMSRTSSPTVEPAAGGGGLKADAPRLRMFVLNPEGVLHEAVKISDNAGVVVKKKEGGWQVAEPPGKRDTQLSFEPVKNVALWPIRGATLEHFGSVVPLTVEKYWQKLGTKRPCEADGWCPALVLRHRERKRRLADLALLYVDGNFALWNPSRIRAEELKEYEFHYVALGHAGRPSALVADDVATKLVNAIRPADLAAKPANPLLPLLAVVAVATQCCVPESSVALKSAANYRLLRAEGTFDGTANYSGYHVVAVVDNLRQPLAVANGCGVFWDIRAKRILGTKAVCRHDEFLLLAHGPPPTRRPRRGTARADVRRVESDRRVRPLPQRRKRYDSLRLPVRQSTLWDVQEKEETLVRPAAPSSPPPDEEEEDTLVRAPSMPAGKSADLWRTASKSGALNDPPPYPPPPPPAEPETLKRTESSERPGSCPPPVTAATTTKNHESTLTQSAASKRPVKPALLEKLAEGLTTSTAEFIRQNALKILGVVSATALFVLLNPAAVREISSFVDRYGEFFDSWVSEAIDETVQDIGEMINEKWLAWDLAETAADAAAAAGGGGDPDQQ